MSKSQIQKNGKERQNMNTEHSLKTLLQERVALFADSNRPAEIIDEYTEKMFTEVIKDQFRGYGDMNKAVTEAIKEAMPGNISEQFELTRYNSLLTNALQQKWAESGISDELVGRMSEAVSETVEAFKMPETVSLRNILDSFVETHKEEAFENGWEKPDVRIEESEGYSGSTYFHIYFDKEPKEPESVSSRLYRSTEKSKYSLANSMAVSTRHSKDSEGGSPAGEVYSGVVDGDVLSRKQGLHLSEHEKLMVGLYYGRATLIIDCDEDDFYYPGYD